MNNLRDNTKPFLSRKKRGDKTKVRAKLKTRRFLRAVFDNIRHVGVHGLMWYWQLQAMPKSGPSVGIFYVMNVFETFIRRHMWKSLAKILAFNNKKIKTISGDHLEESEWRLNSRKKYFQQRRWKKAVLLKTLIWQMLGEYRKILKSSFFNKLLRMYFYNAAGLVWEGSIYSLWTSLRQYNRRYSVLGSLVDNLRSLFDLRLVSFVLLMGIFIYPVQASEFVERGYIRVNGIVNFNPNKIFIISDMLQFNLQKFYDFMLAFSTLFWTDMSESADAKKFLVMCPILLLYGLFRLPFRYELSITHDLLLNSRLFMYLLRQSHAKEAKNPTWERLLGDRRVYARQKVKIKKNA